MIKKLLFVRTILLIGGSRLIIPPYEAKRMRYINKKHFSERVKEQMTERRIVSVGTKIHVGPRQNLTLISGPCVIESRDHTLRCAEELIKATQNLPVQLIFKASYDKANRSSHSSFRGPGIDEGLKILQEVKKQFGLPVISDIHDVQEIEKAKDVLDVLQIPAFLCRQTDLIVTAAKTLLPLHIKKGQFMAPWDMSNVVQKAASQGNHDVILCDRGTMFGYSNLVVDMRAFQIMRGLGVPVSFDASHSVQLPGAMGVETGGQREFIPLLARSAVAAGIDLLFIETHPEPKAAKSDKTNVFPLYELRTLLETLLPIHQLAHKSQFFEDYERVK